MHTHRRRQLAVRDLQDVAAVVNSVDPQRLHAGGNNLNIEAIVKKAVQECLNEKQRCSYTLTTEQAAKFLNVSVPFLERDRWAGARIPFVKVGARAVRYDLRVLQQYLEDNTRRSTSDAGEQR